MPPGLCLKAGGLDYSAGYVLESGRRKRMKVRPPWEGFPKLTTRYNITAFAK